VCIIPRPSSAARRGPSIHLFLAPRNLSDSFPFLLANPFVCFSFLSIHRIQRRNPKKNPVKLEMMKYDPRVRQHVLFTEQKMK
jgi:ribosomal protein L33